MAEHFYLPPRKKTNIAAIDLDGTLAWSTWEPGQKRSVVGDPIWENVQKMQDLIDAGYYIWIYTARHWSDYEMIGAWLEYHNIHYDKIICGKLLFDIFIDDRNKNARDEHWRITW